MFLLEIIKLLSHNATLMFEGDVAELNTGSNSS